MDKQQQIQEMAYILHQSEHELTNDFDCEGDCANCWCSSKKRASALYDKGYRKVITEKTKMEETKLTYEEIVKAYENLSTGYGSGVVGDLNTATLELLIEQKAEIERLTKERNKYKELYETMYRKYSDLTHREFNFNAIMKQKDEYLDKALELQKQVDELKEENNRYAEVFGMVGKDFYTVEVGEWEKVKSGVKDMIQKTRKDTAKEVYQEFYDTVKVFDKKDTLSIDLIITRLGNIIKRKGVEVE